MRQLTFAFLATITVLGSTTPAGAQILPKPILEDAIVNESSAGPAAQVSTLELRALMADGSAVLIDARPPEEFGMSHIPGAVNVAPKPGVPMSVYISDVEEVKRLIPNTLQLLVLYCNGPFCGKSKRLSAELAAAGYINLRRYQLGMPGWRTTGGAAVTEPDQICEVAKRDKTSWFVDAGLLHPKTPLFAARILPGEVVAAKDDGRLPVHDHNTRLIVIGPTAAQASAVAKEITANAYHNVSYYDGNGETYRICSKPKQ